MIDTHAHLSSSVFDKDREAVLDRAAAVLHHVVEVGIAPDSSEFAVKLARSRENVLATVGIHPHEASRFEPSDVDAIEALVETGVPVAVGETGLDHYRDYAPHDLQEALFRRHISLALDHDLPLVIHSRGAEVRVLEVLEEMGAGRVGGVLHCYGGPPELVGRVQDLGFYLGFGGAVTRSKGRYRKMLPLVSLDRMLLETDCPYLAPAPGTSRRNEPAFVAEVVPVMSTMLDIPGAEIDAATDDNARKLFRLPTTASGSIDGLPTHPQSRD